MRLTRYTDYAMRVLLHLGTHQERLCGIGEIARDFASKPEERDQLTKKALLDAQFAPEVLSRVDTVFAFTPLEGLDVARVVALEIERLVQQFGLKIAGAGIDARILLNAIEALKIRQPALADFSAAKNLDADNQKITYAFHTHAAPARGGWTSGVPNPDEDGIWFYIDLHDPASTAQIHTQPMGPKLCLGGQHVSFLSLAGDRVRELDRETLVAFYVDGDSLLEMSDRFDSPVGTIKRRLHVARKRLAKQLEELAPA